MNKYHNKIARCLSRHIHQSKAEANYCNRLLAMKQAGEIYDFKSQIPFELRVGGQLVCEHIVDFKVWKKCCNNPQERSPYDFHCVNCGRPVGGFEVHEVKGFRTKDWEIKRKLFRALYPDIPYIIIDKRNRFDKMGELCAKLKLQSIRNEILGGGDIYGNKAGIRPKKRNGCDHGEGLKRQGVCVICSGLNRPKG